MRLVDAFDVLYTHNPTLIVLSEMGCVSINQLTS
jgi:hypothetical protein